MLEQKQVSNMSDAYHLHIQPLHWTVTEPCQSAHQESMRWSAFPQRLPLRPVDQSIQLTVKTHSPTNPCDILTPTTARTTTFIRCIKYADTALLSYYLYYFFSLKTTKHTVHYFFRALSKVEISSQTSPPCRENTLTLLYRRIIFITFSD